MLHCTCGQRIKSRMPYNDFTLDAFEELVQRCWQHVEAKPSHQAMEWEDVWRLPLECWGDSWMHQYRLRFDLPDSPPPRQTTTLRPAAPRSRSPPPCPHERRRSAEETLDRVSELMVDLNNAVRGINDALQRCRYREL